MKKIQKRNEENIEELEELSYKDRVLRALEGRSEEIKIEVLDYASSLKPEDLIDWLTQIGKFFEWNPMTKEKKMKFAWTKLKGHAMIWWDHLQKERTRKEKEKIKTWSKMGKKLKENFLSMHYSKTLFCRFQNLKQNLSSVQDYTNEFYKFSICIEHQ